MRLFPEEESSRHSPSEHSEESVGTVLVVSASSFSAICADKLKKERFEVLTCTTKEEAISIAENRHIDAVVAERHLGKNDPTGGMQLAEYFRVYRGRFGGSEYPVVIVVTVWNAAVEEDVLRYEAIPAEHDTTQIVRHLQTALRVANSATTESPRYTIVFDNPIHTHRLCEGCRINRILFDWGPHHKDITPPSDECLLLLVSLLLRRNHPVDLEYLTHIHNNVPFYYRYLGKPRRVTYKAMKQRIERLRSFLEGTLGEVPASMIFRTMTLEDGKRHAYKLWGKSLKFICEVIKKEDRT